MEITYHLSRQKTEFTRKVIVQMGNKICLSEGIAQNLSQKALIQSKFQCSKSSLGSLRNSAISLLVLGSYLDFLYWQRALVMIRWQ